MPGAYAMIGIGTVGGKRVGSGIRPAAGALLFLLLLWVTLAGCVPGTRPLSESPATAMVKVRAGRVPRFTDDMGFSGLPGAIEKSIAYLEKLPEERTFAFGGDTVSRDRLIDSLKSFLAFISTRPTEEALNAFLDAHYQVYRSRGDDGDGSVLFTGYYEPILSGSLTPSDKYPYPVYGVPDDLVSVDLSKFSEDLGGGKLMGRVQAHTLVPYYDREAIDSRGVLDGKATVIAWVSNPVDLFFLQVQGSGKICLNNGQTLNVHYGASNGLPYKSIGKELIQSGKIARKDMSMQAIRDYLKRHPGERTAILDSNPSYVFFTTEESGPLGCLEETLTSGRSLAVDQRLFPMAALSFIQTKKPVIDGDGHIIRWEECTRFMLDQDTGGAIRGPGRADLFWGEGPYAKIAAGHMNQEGRLFFLVLKGNS